MNIHIRVVSLLRGSTTRALLRIDSINTSLTEVKMALADYLLVVEELSNESHLSTVDIGLGSMPVVRSRRKRK